MSIHPDSANLVAVKMAINKMCDFIKIGSLVGVQEVDAQKRNRYWEGYKHTYQEMLAETKYIFRSLIYTE